MPEPNQKFVLAVFEEYHTGLRRYLVSRLRGRPLEAADVAQETYLRLLRMNDVDAVEHPQAYVYRVAANVIRELGLKEQTQASLPERLDDPSLTSHTLNQPDDAAEHQIHMQALERAIRRLPPTTQAVLILKKRDGLSREEIAAELGISVHTVKKHLLKAVAWCRQHGTLDNSRQHGTLDNSRQHGTLDDSRQHGTLDKGLPQ
jgi:RNA polymerase sigma-70 factor (ECF subfamily)